MENILLLCPSLYREGLPEREYSSGVYAKDRSFTCSHTNIPVFSAVTAHLAGQGEQIDRVIMLASQECHEIKHTELGELSTLDYIKARFDRIRQEERGAAVKPMEYTVITVDVRESAESIRNTVNRELGRLPAKHAAIWVDFTSGLRSHAILLVFLLRYFETQQGFTIRDILYANISGGQRTNPIDSCSAVYSLFDTYRYFDAARPVRSPNPKPAHSNDQRPEPNRQLSQADMDQQRLNQLTNSLKSSLSNTTEDKTAQIRKVREEVGGILAQTQDPMTAALARKMLDSLPEKIDKLSQVEYMISRDLVSPAMLRLKETAFDFLASTGVIRLYGKTTFKHVETELISARFYYESFLAFMLELLKRLSSDLSLSPVGEFRRVADSLPEERYAKGEQKTYKAHPELSAFARRKFEDVCSGAIARKRQDFIDQSRQALGSGGADSASSIKVLLEAGDQYQLRTEAYEQIFMQTGFPMACTDFQRHAFMYDYYREHLTGKAQLLMKALGCIQSRTDNALASQLMKCLPQGAGYREALEYCGENLPTLIGQPYSFFGYQHKNWDCGLQDPNQLKTFLNTYMPLHNSLRKLRNGYAHALNLTAELSSGQQMELAVQCIGMLRKLSSQPRRV